MHNLYLILVPGIIFQSVLIGGGYASGREIMEYVARFGGNGMFVILLAGLLFSLFLFLAFEFARVNKSYDYRSWARQLLGRFSYLFDILFLVMAVIVIAIMVSIAGNTLHSQAGISYFLATSLVIVPVFIISFFGVEWIIRYKFVGTILLYAAFIYFFVAILSQSSFQYQPLSFAPIEKAWIISSIIYVGYNLAVIPACLFTVSTLNTKKQIWLASIFGGLLATIPMALLYFILVNNQALLHEPLPLLTVLKNHLNETALSLYYVVLVWTLIETTVGLTHAIIESTDKSLATQTKKHLTGLQRAFFAVLIASGAVWLAQVGIIDLIANYYSIMAWGFIALFALPLLYRAPKLIAS